MKTSLKNQNAILNVRKIELRDKARWSELWSEYCRFYERASSEEITQYLWTRVMNSESPVYSIVAEDENNRILGIANYILHENTSTLNPVCYLQDLFVDPKMRGLGIGGKIIDWLLSEVKTQNWSRLYWHTKENNYRARELYDKYNSHSGFLLYKVLPS